MPLELTDTHTHTHYSGHGLGTPGELVAAAAEKGLTTLAITEHQVLPRSYDPIGEFSMLPEQVEPYRADVLAAREAREESEALAAQRDTQQAQREAREEGEALAAQRDTQQAQREARTARETHEALEESREEAARRHPHLEIILGAELDWFEGAEPFLLDLLAQYPYELRLGSVHFFARPDGGIWEFDHARSIEGWHERGEEQVWREYVRLWIDAVNSAVPFDVMAHPDIPKKMGFPFPASPRFDAREVYAAMAEAAAAKDRMVEVNTSGLYRPIGEVYPAPELLRAFCEAGVPCTVSSDAHQPEDVGRDLSRAHAAMRAAGYRKLTVPTRSGDRRTIALQ
ncbi:MAG: PHP domain-containing protein [Coriobacteriales bacterium]|jgi:histidinol-phosphatase (PHP family)|nr:PHP domain-containing protein [Coriobacteriales bacterium]